MEKMCRLTFHLEKVLQLYKTHSHGPLDIPEVQRCFSRLEGLLLDRKDWKEEVARAQDWAFGEP